MKRLLALTCAISVALTATTASAIHQPVLKWTNSSFGSNAYYLNGNVDGNAALVGQIGFGGKMIDSDGIVVESLDVRGQTVANPGAKSIVRIGDYYYITGQNGGIGRFDATGANAWNIASWAPTPAATVVIPGITNPESIVTDGTWLFTNDDEDRDRIHAYSISNSATSFILTEEWEADLDGNPATETGRVRGLSYDAGSGYLYVHNGGAGSADTLYAVDASDGTVHNMGQHIEGGYTYQVLRYGDELLTVGYSDNLSVYDLASDTAIAAGGPKQQFDLGLDNLYGLTIADGTLVVASLGGKVSGFEMVPEPGTLVLLGLGGLFLGLTRSRRRRG